MRESIIPGNINQQANLLKLAEEKALTGAYLFEGPDGVGKLALALECAARISRKPNRLGLLQREGSVELLHPLPTLKPSSGNVDPLSLLKDDQIESYKNLYTELSGNPLLPFEHPAKAQYRVQQIRYLKSKLSNSKIGSKSVILSQADSMNKESANAMLKMLEEPPLNTFFFILAENRKNLLPTIISRCKPIRLTNPSQDELKDWLVSKGLLDNTQNADALLALSQNAGDFLAMTEENLKAYDTVVNFLRAVLKKNSYQLALTEIIEKELKSSSYDYQLLFFKYLTLFFNKAFRSQFIKEKVPRTEIEKFSINFGRGINPEVIETLENGKTMLESNVQKEMVFTSVALKIRQALL
ncbi:MAG: AAA family ATPase [Candidatus Kapaibacteriales bacterium]